MTEEDFELESEVALPPVEEDEEDELNADKTEEEKRKDGFQRGEWAE